MKIEKYTDLFKYALKLDIGSSASPRMDGTAVYGLKYQDKDKVGTVNWIRLDKATAEMFGLSHQMWNVIVKTVELHKICYNDPSDEVWGLDPRCASCECAFPCATIQLIRDELGVNVF